MKRAVTVWILNTAISLLFRIEARARKLRATAEACKTCRIGGELIEIPGGIGTRNGNLKITQGRIEIRGTLRPMFRAPLLQNQGDVPRVFIEPDPRPKIFQR